MVISRKAYCSLLLFGIALLCGCAAVRTVRFDHASYGRSPLPFASPLTDFEVETLKAEKKRSTSKTRLQLALLMGGSVRTRQAAGPLIQKFDTFVDATRKSLGSERDPWQRGFKLFRAFHVHLLGFDEDDPELNNYRWDQTTVDGVLRGEGFNCLSSAILFALAAERLGFEVLGVRVKNHVFVELFHVETNKRFEVETTSATGFDWVHDKPYYTEKERDWAASRGLSPTTYEDYLSRERISLRQLILTLYNVQHTYEGVMSEPDRIRLIEITGFLSNEKKHQKARLAAWSNLFVYFSQASRYQDLLRVAKSIDGSLNKAAKRLRTDPETKDTVAGILDMRAIAQTELGRHAEAMRTEDRIDDLLSSRGLRQNRIYVYQRAGHEKFAARDWTGAVEIFQRCQADFPRDLQNACMANLQSTFVNWSLENEKQGNWPKAAEVLRQCTSYDANFKECADRLAKLRSEHKGVD